MNDLWLMSSRDILAITFRGTKLAWNCTEPFHEDIRMSLGWMDRNYMGNILG